MHYEIRRWDNDDVVIRSGEADSFVEFVEKAVEGGVDLSFADLSGRDLSRANLRGALLFRANMDGCDMSGGNLDQARMTLATIRSSNLSGACISGAILKGANMMGSNLSHANLSGSDLRNANMMDVNLIDADMSGSFLAGAFLQGADMKRTKVEGPIPAAVTREQPESAGENPKPNADTTTRESVLDTARAAVCGRGRAYGGPEESFSRISALWNTHLRNRYGEFQDLDTTDVAVMLLLLKVARVESTPDHMDSWVDMAGYAACGAECAGVKPTTEGETK